MEDRAKDEGGSRSSSLPQLMRGSQRGTLAGSERKRTWHLAAGKGQIALPRRQDHKASTWMF